MYDNELEKHALSVAEAFDRLKAFNDSLHRNFVRACCVAAISTAACVLLLIDRLL